MNNTADVLVSFKGTIHIPADKWSRLTSEAFPGATEEEKAFNFLQECRMIPKNDHIFESSVSDFTVSKPAA